MAEERFFPWAGPLAQCSHRCGPTGLLSHTEIYTVFGIDRDYQIIGDIYCFLGYIYINRLLKNLDCAYPLIIKFCNLIF